MKKQFLWFINFMLYVGFMAGCILGETPSTSSSPQLEQRNNTENRQINVVDTTANHSETETDFTIEQKPEFGFDLQKRVC